MQLSCFCLSLMMKIGMDFVPNFVFMNTTKNPTKFGGGKRRLKPSKKYLILLFPHKILRIDAIIIKIQFGEKSRRNLRSNHEVMKVMSLDDWFNLLKKILSNLCDLMRKNYRICHQDRRVISPYSGG